MNTTLDEDDNCDGMYVSDPEPALRQVIAPSPASAPALPPADTLSLLETPGIIQH
jgi:hypothetical protein